MFNFNPLPNDLSTKVKIKRPKGYQKLYYIKRIKIMIKTLFSG